MPTYLVKKKTRLLYVAIYIDRVVFESLLLFIKHTKIGGRKNVFSKD